MIKIQFLQNSSKFQVLFHLQKTKIQIMEKEPFIPNRSIDKKQIGKPNLSSNNNKKPQLNLVQQTQKIQLYYKYRIPMIYRQLKMPIYDSLLKPTQKPINNKKVPQLLSLQKSIDILYKFMALNSKYHHREKMRFGRMPMLKYIKYDFVGLRQKLQNKNFQKQYEDLDDSYDDDEQKEKKQYIVNDQFNQQALQNFRKKNNLGSRKIVIAKGYEDLKERLVNEYDWFENQQQDSLFFDLKFMSKKKDIDNVNLLDKQIINHFDENKSITAKFGLCRNIRNIVNLGGDLHEYFPKCYDVNDVSQLQDFYQQFKKDQAERALKDYVYIRQGKITQKQQFLVKETLACYKRQCLPIIDKLNLILKQKPAYISEIQFNTIQQYFDSSKRKIKESPTKAQQAQKIVNVELLEQCRKVLQQAQKNDKQYHLNEKNIWIVKPASMSRGRGIKTFNKIDEIFDYINGNEISWVIQKYIERPLIIKKRKFDIRQWVLVTDFKPLRVWVYDQCYVRFCAELYDTQNLKNRKIHLTNNSVTKGVAEIKGDYYIEGNMMTMAQFSKTIYLELQTILENSHSKGQQFTPQKTKLYNDENVFSSYIKPQINKIAIQTIKSVRQNIKNRANTFELFGYDFMVDEQLRVWLIEVNSSPTMQYSTKVTERLVKQGMSDLGDLIAKYMCGGHNFKKDFGGWKLLTNRS